MSEFLHLLIVFAASIAFIILMTAKVRMHAFFVLILAALGVGIAAGLPALETLGAAKDGFGRTLGAIGIVIAAGTTLGVVLERTGAALSMAEFILKLVGSKRSPFAMSVTGLLFGIPIFCDSGFVVLSPLNRSLAERTRTSMAVMAASLGTSLLAIHCFIPPHPGATAAAGIAGVDLGMLMLVGILVAIPTALMGFAWVQWYAARNEDIRQTSPETAAEPETITHRPSAGLSFLPILLPIALIAAKSLISLFISVEDPGFFLDLLFFIGDPSIALLIGLAVSLLLVAEWKKEILDGWFGQGIVNAGSILAITAAGGAFGAVLKATGIGTVLGENLATLGLGIFLPFIIAAALKTAQGSSTVAVITAASLLTPMFPDLGLNEGAGPLLAVLAMGAGSMVVSHANDSYFWVVTKFSDLDLKVTLRIFTSATFVMGVTAILLIFVLSLFLA